ncbi:MAG: hypothetical protein IPQ07_40390 [Myxococcales bacterium]|nr:hypothetical protein [Myxococcales bacterium]
MIAAGVGGFDDRPQQAKTPTGTFEVAARRGLRGETVTGLKLSTLGIQLSIRQQLSAKAAGRGRCRIARRREDRRDQPDQRCGLTQARLGAHVATKRRSPTWAWNMGPMTTFSLLRPLR